MPADGTITIRRIPFEFPAGIDPLIVEGQPEESYTQVGLSLLLPYLEPYLIRSIHAAKKHVTDPKLLADMEAFNGQEGQHYRQHRRFNDAMRLPAADILKALEAEVEADYTRFSESKSLRWNLAYAEGFEAYTMALARFSFETGALDRMQPAARDLYSWHLVEELEHRTVAFDVYAHVSGGYFYRVVISLYAQWHLNRFVFRAANAIAESDPEGFKKEFGGRVRAMRRTSPLFWKMFTGLLPKIMGTYLPWYSPHKIPMPPRAQEIADEYARRAEEIAAKRDADTKERSKP